MNDAFKMWNQSIEDMDQNIDQGQRPGHVFLMPGDTNYPRPIVAHPPWARSAPQVGEPDVVFPDGPAPPTATQAETQVPPPAPTPERELGPKRSRTATESGPRPSSSTRPTTASDAPSSSTRPRPTVGASSTQASASEPEAPPVDSGWTIPMETTDHVLITHHFKVRSGKVYGTKLAKRKDGGGFVNAMDETPRGAVGKTNQQIYLRRLVTMLARSGGLSANIETGFHLPTYIQKSDEEWLRLYSQVYHLMHLDCTQCLPEPAVLTACVFDDRTDEWVRTNFPEEEILALRGAESRLLEAMNSASRPDATVWKGGNTMLITDFNLHSKANNSPSKMSPGIALKNKGWSAIEVYSPPEVSRDQDNVANFAVTMKRAYDRLQRVNKDVLSKLTVHVHLSLYGVMLAPLSDEVLESSYIKPITEVHGLVPRSAVVTINDDPLFNGLDHTSLSYGIVVKKLAKELRANGCLVLTTSSMWPKLLSVTGGAGHRIKAEQADLGWSLLEKSMLNEKVLATCMLDPVKINVMSACIKPFNLDHVRINRIFTFIDDDEVKFISADATAGEEQASATRDLARIRRTERRRSDLPFGSEDIALIEPKPYHDHETFWWKIDQYQTPNERTTVPGRAFYCEQCRNSSLDSDSLRNSAFGSYCPGCAFKEQWRQYQDVVTCDDWKRLEQYAGACAVYLYNNHFLDHDSGEAVHNLRDCIKLFIKHCASMSRSNLAKTISSMGALRVPVNIAVEYCQQGRAKHLGWERALTYDGDVCYIAYYDPGNAAYAGYMNCLFTRDEITDMCRGSPDPSEELLGDILETAAGLLTVACRFPDLFPMWGGKQEVEACLRGIERSFHRYAAVESITLFPTQSRKKRRPAAVTEEERIGIDELLHSVPYTFMADPADRPEEEGEAVQTRVPQPVQEPEFHAAPEEDVAHSIATGEEPEEEEVDIDGLSEGQLEVRELVHQATEGFTSIRTLLARNDICLSCGADDHNTFSCRMQPGNPDPLALGIRILDSFFENYRPLPRRAIAQPEQQGVDTDVEMIIEESDAQPATTPAQTLQEVAAASGAAPLDQRPPLPRHRAAQTGAESSETVPSPTVGPTLATRPKAKARPTRWNRAVTSTGVVEIIYDQANTAIELVRAREGLFSVRGVELNQIGLVSHKEVGHHIRRAVGESMSVHPRRGDPIPQGCENVDEYFHVARGVYGGDLKLMPRRGGEFLSSSWQGFRAFDESVDISQREYHLLDGIMYDLNSVLRHKIGRHPFSVSFRGSATFPTLKCDEGGWVDIDELLERDLFWMPHWSERAAGGNPAEKRRRLKLLMKANWAVGQRTHRYRLQFLGVKVCPLPANVQSGNPFEPVPVSIDVQIAENQNGYDANFEDVSIYTQDDVWIRPWAVRASSGHSHDRHSVIHLDANKIAFHPTAQLVDELGGGFHATSIRNIHGIINDGILPVARKDLA